LNDLSQWPNDSIEELWKRYDILNDRRKEAQTEAKKFSGESEKKEIGDSTQLSPSGEE
jgi:hypothetical protein